MQVTLWEPMVGKATMDKDMIGRCSEARRVGRVWPRYYINM